MNILSVIRLKQRCLFLHLSQYIYLPYNLTGIAAHLLYLMNERRYIYVVVGIQSTVYDVNNRPITIVGFYLAEMVISPMEDGISSASVAPSLSEIVPLRHEPRYDADNPSDVLAARLQISDESATAFVYWPKLVITARCMYLLNTLTFSAS